jgi:hypothetical protein
VNGTSGREMTVFFCGLQKETTVCFLQGKQRSFFLVINRQIYNVGVTCDHSAKKKYNGDYITKNLK